MAEVMRQVFSASKRAKLLIDPKYKMDEVVVAYQEARNVLKSEGFRPTKTFEALCLWYALKEQDEGIRAEVRNTLDNMALISALELTISLPMYLNPPNFYELSANRVEKLEVDQFDDMVRLWMMVSALVVMAQGACIFQTMNFRTFAIGSCLSDMHFLPVYAKHWGLQGTVGILSITLFLGGLFGLIAQFCISGFLLYAPDDCWAIVAVTAVLAAWVLWNHVSYLRHAYSLSEGCTKDFVAQYCNQDGEIKAEVLNPMQSGAIVQSASRGEQTATS